MAWGGPRGPLRTSELSGLGPVSAPPGKGTAFGAESGPGRGLWGYAAGDAEPTPSGCFPVVQEGILPSARGPWEPTSPSRILELSSPLWAYQEWWALATARAGHVHMSFAGRRR